MCIFDIYIISIEKLKDEEESYENTNFGVSS